jgi:hypothetical protein
LYTAITTIDLRTEDSPLAALVDSLYFQHFHSGNESIDGCSIVTPIVCVGGVAGILILIGGDMDSLVAFSLLIFLDGGFLSRVMSSPSLLTHIAINIAIVLLSLHVVLKPVLSNRWMVCSGIIAALNGINFTLRAESLPFIIFSIAIFLIPRKQFRVGWTYLTPWLWEIGLLLEFFVVVGIGYFLIGLPSWTTLQPSWADFADEYQLMQWGSALNLVGAAALVLYPMLNLRESRRRFLYCVIAAGSLTLFLPGYTAQDALAARLIDLRLFVIIASGIVLSRQSLPMLSYGVLFVAMAQSWIARYRFRPLEMEGP